MKKFVYMVLALCMFLCTGCTKPQIDYNFDKYDYEVFERPGIGYYSENEENAIVLLKDYDSYQEYVDTISQKKIGVEFREKLNTYDSVFFEDKVLVVVVYEAMSGMSKLSIRDIVYEEDNIKVVLCCDYPGDGAMTEDIKDYAILLRLPKDDTYKTIEYRVEDRYELPGDMFPN